MIITASDILKDLQSTGHTVRLDGNTIRVRPALPPEKVELLRQHKPEIIELLKSNFGSGNAVTVTIPPVTIPKTPISSPAPTKTYTRLELATDCLGKLIPDEQARRKIRALAEADARGWRFLGTAGYQHILAGNILDAVEQATGKLICFTGCDAPDRFLGWFCKEIKP